MEGQRPLVSPPVKNWGLTITSQYAFLSCLSSFMIRSSGVLGVEEPHQSIPNLVVKLYCGDDTADLSLQAIVSRSQTLRKLSQPPDLRGRGRAEEMGENGH
nr:hypothetical protein Pyn_20557 [Ipomoea batatas]